MSIQYGIIYGKEGSPGFDLDAPYDSAQEAAVEGFDAEVADEYGGADLVEVHKCTVDHVDTEWEPGAHVMNIDTHVDASDVRQAVREDWEWLTGEAQMIESWAGTEPTDVDPLDMPQGATSVLLHDVAPERRSWLLDYATDQWKRRARRWKKQEVV